jgi:hypothetical protein
MPPQIYRPVGEPFDSSSRDGCYVETLVRLRPSASITAAQAELDVRGRDMQRAHEADAHLAAREPAFTSYISLSLAFDRFRWLCCGLMIAYTH